MEETDVNVDIPATKRRKVEYDLNEVVSTMPKVELHAHLNGSISDALLEHLKNIAKTLKNNSPILPSIDSDGVLMDTSQYCRISEDVTARSLKECWKSFATIHEVITTPRILYIATVNIIAEFSTDNVIYLELRTSPKKVNSIPSKLSYLEAVLKGIGDGQKKFPIIVKLLISIDRKLGEDEAAETIELANKVIKKYPELMVGLDVSGDPNCGHHSWIVRVMEEARKRKFNISCHLPEIVNSAEGLAFMTFGPERVGHGQYLHPSYGGTLELWNLTKQKKIPIETCLSSNLVSGVAASLESHVVKYLHNESVPFVICTDDSGVFKTTLSNEFKKFITVVHPSLEELRSLCLNTIKFSFATTSEKDLLTQRVKSWWQKNYGLS